MRIYIADLSAYNAGKLIGKWLDLDDYTDAEALKDAVFDWLKERGIEEYAIHDYDDCPAHDEFGEYPDWNEIFTYHTLYKEYGDSFATWFGLSYPDCDYDTWEDKYNDDFEGEWDNWKDYAQCLIDECGVLGEIPDQLAPYIDYVAFARDLQCSGEYTEQDGYFFRNY